MLTRSATGRGSTTTSTTSWTCPRRRASINVIENIHDHIDLIGYVHAADVPGHREPGTGEINYPNVLQALADAGYDVGAEFVPMGAPETAIRKVRAMLADIQ
jgi:hydroxypyruvate isomerase